MYPKAYQWQETKNSVLVSEKLELNGQNKTSLSFSQWSLFLYVRPSVLPCIHPRRICCQLHTTKGANTRTEGKLPTSMYGSHFIRPWVTLTGLRGPLLRHVITIFNGLVIDSSSKLYSKGSQSPFKYCEHTTKYFVLSF